MTYLNTRFLGKVLLRFPELDSTQDFAQQLLAEGLPEEGTLVMASHQTRGKGLLTNRWESEPGQNLLLSIILYPTFLPLKQSFLFSQAIGLGVRDWVGQHIPDARVKWPNDVYAGDKKLAGVLVQNSLSGAKIQNTVVGIGLNLNQTRFPEHLPNPTSLKGETGVDFDPDHALNGLCQSLEYWYLRLKNGEWGEIQNEYLRHLYGLGEWRTFGRRDGSTFRGRIMGVEENGYLSVDLGERKESFEVKEILFK